MYFGIWSDVDLGHGEDDYVGSDTSLGLVFAWNGDDLDEEADGYGLRPPAIGYIVVDGMSVNDDGVDNDSDGRVDEDDERLGISKFVSYNNDDAVQGNPSSGDDAYRYLRGLWRDDVPITFGGTGRGFSDVPTDFMYTGDPPSFWSEENVDDSGTRNEPGDRRLLLSVGPFRLKNGGTKEIVIALAWAQSDDRFASVRMLKDGVPGVRGGIPEQLSICRCLDRTSGRCEGNSGVAHILVDAGGNRPSHTNSNWLPTARFRLWS